MSLQKVEGLSVQIYIFSKEFLHVKHTFSKEFLGMNNNLWKE